MLYWMARIGAGTLFDDCGVPHHMSRRGPRTNVPLFGWVWGGCGSVCVDVGSVWVLQYALRYFMLFGSMPIESFSTVICNPYVNFWFDS